MGEKSPAAIAALAERTYLELAPALGTHSVCREFVAIVAGVCAARGIEYRVVFDKHHREGNQCSPHFSVVFATGEIVDMWEPHGRRARLTPGASPRATGRTPTAAPGRTVRA